MSLLVETKLACKVCGQEKLDGPIQRSGEYDIYHCRGCDVVFAHPMRNPGPKWYEKFQVSHRLGGADALTWDHKMFLKDVTVSAQTLLDVGCGSGVFLAAAKKKGFAVTGVDFDSNAVSVAKAGHGLDDLFCGSLG